LNVICTARKDDENVEISTIFPLLLSLTLSPNGQITAAFKEAVNQRRRTLLRKGGGAAMPHDQEEKVMRRFEGRTVLVTGAASGIGAACVQRLFDEGAQIAAGDVSQEALDRLRAQFGEDGRLLGAVVDVCDRASVERFVGKAKDRFGSLHGLINCAGIKGVGSVLDFDPANWETVISVNLTGTFNMCQAFSKAVKEDKTSRAIVNISSGAGVLGVPNRLAYVASKFGVSGITRSMAPELGPHGIRVNAIAPGMTKTPFTEYMFQDPEAVKRIQAAHPIGRAGEPEEIAAVIVFLLTDDASFMTGSIVSVDGGQTACL
jgi:NAD(P)-dependent dehydrogenase (short-subunit alcohol dehydrogenase family)